MRSRGEMTETLLWRPKLIQDYIQEHVQILMKLSIRILYFIDHLEPVTWSYRCLKYILSPEIRRECGNETYRAV